MLPHRVQVGLPVGQEGVELGPVRRVERPVHRRVDVHHPRRLVDLGPHQPGAEHCNGKENAKGSEKLSDQSGHDQS